MDEGAIDTQLPLMTKVKTFLKNQKAGKYVSGQRCWGAWREGPVVEEVIETSSYMKLYRAEPVRPHFISAVLNGEETGDGPVLCWAAVSTRCCRQSVSVLVAANAVMFYLHLTRRPGQLCVPALSRDPPRPHQPANAQAKSARLRRQPAGLLLPEKLLVTARVPPVLHTWTGRDTSAPVQGQYTDPSGFNSRLTLCRYS